MVPGAGIHDNDEWAGGLTMAVAEKHHRAGSLIYFHGDPDQILLVLQKWLDPERPPRPGTGRDPVMDALAAARLLEYRWIHKLAPSLMPWLCFDRYHMRVRQLLGHLDHSDIHQVVATYIRDRLARSGGLGRAHYWTFAVVLSHFGFYDDVRWVADRALARSEPWIRQVGRNIVGGLLDVPEAGCE